MIEQIFWICRSISVAHTIKARQIGRSLRRRQNVINCNRIIGMRQGDIDDLRA